MSQGEGDWQAVELGAAKVEREPGLGREVPVGAELHAMMKNATPTEAVAILLIVLLR
jgi:hypothetical protein